MQDNCNTVDIQLLAARLKKRYAVDDILKNIKIKIMKRNLNVSLAIIFAIILFSCTKVNQRKDGDWDDNIHLSTKTVEFKATSDSVIIKTEGNWWWVSDISVDTKAYFGFEGVDLQADNYIIKQDCFVVERRDKNTLFIKAEANPNNVKRIISVGLEAGDYFDRVTVTQKAK
jgi:hypothetical protein